MFLLKTYTKIHLIRSIVIFKVFNQGHNASQSFNISRFLITFYCFLNPFCIEVYISVDCWPSSGTSFAK